MMGNRIAFTWVLSYLGVLIHANHSRMSHLEAIQERATKVMHRTKRLVTANWGLTPRTRKMIYSLVAERILLYAASTWYRDLVAINAKLDSIQCGLLLCVTKCYKTVSNDALCVLAGVIPLSLRVQMDRDFVSLTRWRRRVGSSGLSPESFDLWRHSIKDDDLWRLHWTSDLAPRTPYRYYTDGSKQRNGTVGCAYLLATEEGIVRESKFCLTDDAGVFAAEIQAIKEAITDAHRTGISELDVYSDSRSALVALNGMVMKHRSVAEIKNLIRNWGIKVHAHWIRAHVGHALNERADVLAKEATGRPTVDVVVLATRAKAKKLLLEHTLSTWQRKWDTSTTGRITYEIFPRVSVTRLH